MTNKKILTIFILLLLYIGGKHLFKYVDRLNIENKQRKATLFETLSVKFPIKYKVVLNDFVDSNPNAPIISYGIEKDSIEYGFLGLKFPDGDACLENDKECYKKLINKLIKSVDGRIESESLYKVRDYEGLSVTFQYDHNKKGLYQIIRIKDGLFTITVAGHSNFMDNVDVKDFLSSIELL
ncbi:hypothetical protein [Leptospira koniambonensis]|uniref:hypothetical protein n=1 Tax=Leptospira koniambonensis TaxID=2484950 RepID=UPI003EC02C5C